MGRRLFSSAVDPRVTSPGGGVSCDTCHADGGSDGFTWHVDAGPRQTPPLGGVVSATAPMTWTEGVDSLEHEILLTSLGRMASPVGDDASVRALAAWVDTTPFDGAEAAVWSEAGDLEPDAVERGRALFEGSAECASCHVGEALAGAGSHAMFGLDSVDTPTLRGLRGSAPYLHDGRAATLEELVRISEAGGMGRTEHLSAEQRADLVAYLKSL